MASKMYYRWDSLGRPLTPAKPIRDIVERMRVNYPDGAEEFSWYANDAHYQAVPPLDHTPYSSTGWPDPDPEWVVCATDIMNTAVGGAEENQKLFNYWISEARAGRMPWLKYLIWRGNSYDVRSNWAPHSASGHYDHIHISVRTDYIGIGLGKWRLVPWLEPWNGENMRVKFNTTDVPGVPAEVGTRTLWVSPMGYQIVSAAAALDSIMTQGGEGPVVVINAANAPRDKKPDGSPGGPVWSFDRIMDGFCGNRKFPENWECDCGGGGTQPPINLKVTLTGDAVQV